MATAIGGLTLLALAAGSWLTATGRDGLGHPVQVQVTGADGATGLVACGLVVVAAALALTLVGAIGRWIAIGACAVAWLVIGLLTLRLLADGDRLIRQAAMNLSGTDHAHAIHTTALPWLALALSAVALAWTAALAVVTRGWGRPHRFTPASPSSNPSSGGDSGHLESSASWDALSRGEDPT